MTPKKLTRKADAASIIGEDLAEQIDSESKVVARSDALIEMSEGEQPTAEETAELVAEAETPEEVPPSSDVETKSDAPAEPEVEKMDYESLPYGGATSMSAAMKSKEMMEDAQHAMGLFSMFLSVGYNIIDRGDVQDKKGALAKAADEFKSALAAKAMVEESQAQPVSQENVVAKSDHPLQPALDALLTAVDNSANVEGDVNSKLQFVNPVLQELGQAITDFVQKSATQEPAAPDVNNSITLEDMKKLIQPLSDGLQAVVSEVGILKAQQTAQTVQPKSRIPQPRTVTVPPTLTKKSEPEKKGSLRAIMNRSVGLPEDS